MAWVFTAEAPDPDSTYDRLTSWARARHCQLEGNEAGGVIEWDPSYHPKWGLDRLLFPKIAAEYSIRGAELTISTEQDLFSTFADGLRDAGFLWVRSRLVGP